MRHIKIGNNLRNLLLSQPETSTKGPWSCIYKGERYFYEAITIEETIFLIKHLEKILNIK